MVPPVFSLFLVQNNTGKFLNCLFSEAYNVKTIKSSCNVKTYLDRAKLGHSSDMIFVSLAKVFNKNSKL